MDLEDYSENDYLYTRKFLSIMNHFMSDKTIEKIIKVIVLYGGTLMAYPLTYLIISILMSPSLGGPGREPSPEGPFLLSSSLVCLVNVLLYRNIFGKGKVIKSILLNVLVIALCMLLGKFDIWLFPAYYSL